MNHWKLPAFLVIFTVLIAACGPGSSPAAVVPQPTSAVKQVAKPGGNLRYGSRAAVTMLDPSIHSSAPTGPISDQLYDPLIWQPEPNKFVPGLAESWEISPDSKVYTLHLRKDVKFHDGTLLNAAAVKFSLDRIVDPKTKSLQVAAIGPYDKSEVVDEYTVKITLKSTFPIFLNQLTTRALSPSSPTAVAKLGDKWARYSVGTGPFRVKAWPDDNTLVLERNPDYKWGPSFLNHQGPAYLDTITYKFIAEGSTRLIALESGEVDIIDEPPPEEAQRLKTDTRFRVDAVVIGGLPQVLNINVSRPPTNELAVRQAMLYAVDRKSMAKLIFFGALPPANGPFSSGSWAYWTGVESMYNYDLAKAKKLLDDAGWILNTKTGIREKNGQPLRIRHVTSTGYNSEKPATYVQAALKEVGIDDVVEAMAYEASAKRYADNDFELARLGYTGFDPDGSIRVAFHSSQITQGGLFNRSHINDPKIDALIDQGAAETDAAKRKEIYRQLQQIIMDQALIIPVNEQVLYQVFSVKAVQDFKTSTPGQGSPYLVDVWLDQAAK
ncbi:MAG: ABC transporter substrate-binding protein [Chloroflexi bacterium]|nr:ABC transporter substrate-binding protein [Chloroflexota bacterium]